MCVAFAHHPAGSPALPDAPLADGLSVVASGAVPSF